MQMPTLPHPTRCHRRRAKAGFTLVELVTAILTLGVRAAVAPPRCADLQGRAREATVCGVFGAVNAASALGKAAALANSLSCAAGAGTNAALEGNAIALNFCFPQALGILNTGILDAANLGSDYKWLVRRHQRRPRRWRHVGADQPERCHHAGQLLGPLHLGGLRYHPAGDCSRYQRLLTAPRFTAPSRPRNATAHSAGKPRNTALPARLSSRGAVPRSEECRIRAPAAIERVRLGATRRSPETSNQQIRNP